METSPLLGIHHVTVLCNDAQINLDFFTQVLGLRLVKLTVNFDDPGAYHLYYADGVGTPGTTLTFFPYPADRAYVPGNGQFTHTTLAIPGGSGAFWAERLEAAGVRTIRTTSPFGEEAIEFGDPNGMALALFESSRPNSVGWADQPVPTEFAISGVHSVSLATRSISTPQFIVDSLGLTEIGEEDGVIRFQVGNSFIDVLTLERDGHGGHGGVHHVALAAGDDAEQAGWRKTLLDRGAHVSGVMDRDYFHSIYFREPGGSLFEIATLNPGFTVDEEVEHLGGNLQLPPQFADKRDLILESLPRLRLPNGNVVGETKP